MKQYFQNGVFRAIYAISVTIMIFGIFGVIVHIGVDTEIKDVALVIVGALIGELKTISGYYFGSMDKSQSTDANIINIK
jgi:hypothetical protein